MHYRGGAVDGEAVHEGGSRRLWLLWWVGDRPGAELGGCSGAMMLRCGVGYTGFLDGLAQNELTIQMGLRGTGQTLSSARLTPAKHLTGLVMLITHSLLNVRVA